jgi:hypothetical protein
MTIACVLTDISRKLFTEDKTIQLRLGSINMPCFWLDSNPAGKNEVLYTHLQNTDTKMEAEQNELEGPNRRKSKRFAAIGTFN